MKETNSQLQTDKIYTVTEITRLIKQELESAFPLVWVEGEISDLTRAHSGHVYFTLKDETSQLRGIIWRSAAQKVPFQLENGLQVIAKGQINVYEPRGQYQIIVDVVEPKGKGALQLAFEQLREKLQKEGLFDPSVKKTLPLFPKKVGVVTSPRGAAIVDIIRTLERRFARLHILLYPVRVQGEGAAAEIVEGIECLSSLPDVDVVIVGRGGGSMEDLWAFNEEIVARAIYACPIPVISAVGHEVDFTISDFVADIRASTPSAAAEIVVEKEQAFEEWIENLEKRMKHHMQYLIQEEKSNLLGLVHHQAFQNFKLRLLNLSQRVDELESAAGQSLLEIRRWIIEARSRTVLYEEKISGTIRGMIQNLKGLWEKLAATLDSLSPLSILKKGYTLCWRDESLDLIRNVDAVGEKDKVAVSFLKGEISCIVQRVDRDKTIKSRLTQQKKR
ncbi:MAG: exodeoxyribonuclease VII large subunit [Candidatus Aminicenantes bacterium]|jgi:exodeoxyribonuclease VII large subunit